MWFVIITFTNIWIQIQLEIIKGKKKKSLSELCCFLSALWIKKTFQKGKTKELRLINESKEAMNIYGVLTLPKTIQKSEKIMISCFKKTIFIKNVVNHFLNYLRIGIFSL